MKEVPAGVPDAGSLLWSLGADSGNAQAKAWMAAGYQIEAVDIPGERVRFRAHGRNDQ